MIFHLMKDVILAGFEFAIPYLDDVRIKSASSDQYIEHIKHVFDKIKVYGFSLSGEKCDFFPTGNNIFRTSN